VSVPPLALQRCPAVGCGRRLYATLEMAAAPVLACERRHVWLCVRDDSRRDGWRLVYFSPAAAPEA
jgi:hypothetical protein